MFCAPVTLLHSFEEYKTGGLFCPPSDFTGGQNNPPVLYSSKECNNVTGAQNMLK